ncbi:hypothetical protein ACROYT_G030112 [Oculina patagonica]
MGILARLRLAKIRTMARPNSPDIPPKRTKKWCSKQLSAMEEPPLSGPHVVGVVFPSKFVQSTTSRTFKPSAVVKQIPPDVVYDNRVLMSSEIKCQVEPDGIGCPVCSVIFERIILCSIDKSSKSQGEQQTAREALQKRHVCVDDSLIDILSRFNVRTIPSTMAEFNSLFLRIARCEFVTKPSVLMAAFKQGMLETHPELWSELDANTIRAVYARLDPTPGKVLEIIQTCPDDMPLTAQRERVLEFFRRYIRSLTKDKVAVFLQFITGSNLLLVPKIEVAFTSLAGIQRRPIVHTCTGRIDLSTEYESFAAFSKEINKVLTKDESFEYTAI